MAKKIKGIDDLNAIREKALSEINIRSGRAESVITVHMGTCGIAAGAREVLEHLASELESAGATDKVTLKRTGCAGLCDQEPMITLTDSSGKDFKYGKLDKAKIQKIAREHVLGGTPVSEYLIKV